MKTVSYCNKRLKENPHGFTDLKVELFYDLGGFNPFTCKHDKRGYYMVVKPIERYELSDGTKMESFTAFSGTRKLIKECQRQSKKAETEAKAIAPDVERTLVDYILNKYNLQFEE